MLFILKNRWSKLLRQIGRVWYTRYSIEIHGVEYEEYGQETQPQTLWGLSLEAYLKVLSDKERDRHAEWLNRPFKKL